MAKWMAAAVCVAVAAGAWDARAGEGEVKLIPGVQVEFEVPAAPPSLADMKRQSGALHAKMAVKLPANYDPRRTYPVLVFLSGGDGGTGGELHQADPFLGGEGYVLVNLPLFKRDVEGDTYDKQIVVTPTDASVAIPAFRAMLDELRRRVPNIDPSRSVLAGFSNGACGAALMMWSGDRDLLSRFAMFVLVEGGFWLTSDQDDIWSGRRFERANLSGLAGKRVLLLYGDQTQPPDRIPWNEAARRTATELRAAGIDAEARPMTDVGHDFPPAEMDKARAWVLAKPQ